jgi:hypothetical protein
MLRFSTQNKVQRQTTTITKRHQQQVSDKNNAVEISQLAKQAQRTIDDGGSSQMLLQ